MSGYVQAEPLGNYIQVENNPYVLGYIISAWDRDGCHLPSLFSSWCITNPFEWTAGDPISINMYINMAYNAPLPTVSFYMKVENTGQVILIDILTPETGYYSTVRRYYYIQGEQINPDNSISRNPLITLVQAFTTFTLKPIMKDVNGNPAYVFGSISIYATITTPNGVFTTKQVVGYKVYMLTRIANLRVYPNPAESRQGVTISGQLQRFASNNQWVGVPDQQVCINRLAQSQSMFAPPYIMLEEACAETDSNGNFSATITAPSSPGTYTYYAIFDGNDNELLGGSWAGVNLTVVQPTTPKPTPTPTTVKPKLSAGDLAILLGGAGLLTGITVYWLSKKGKA